MRAAPPPSSLRRVYHHAVHPRARCYDPALVAALVEDEEPGTTSSVGRTVSYVHDAAGKGNLEQVNLPENGVLTYLYEDPNDLHTATTINDSSCTSCGPLRSPPVKM